VISFSITAAFGEKLVDDIAGCPSDTAQRIISYAGLSRSSAFNVSISMSMIVFTANITVGNFTT